MTRTADAARGKWRGILLMLGVPEIALRPKHGPCPFCQGTDRYRWDDKDGSGSFFCSQCGSGNGFEMLKRIKGWDFLTAAREIDAIVGNVRVTPVKPRVAPATQRRQCFELWERGKPVKPGDPVHLYFQHRRIELPQNRDSIRFVADCPVPYEVGTRYAMVAKVTAPDGRGATLHRTFLTPQGRKADMAQPRAVMPGTIPDGSAIRLAMHGEVLGIAEGIETAQKASERFSVPVWAAINSTMLAKWTPPEGVTRVMIFGDNDTKFGGQAATFALAHRLAVKGIAVEPHIPPETGRDWADAA